MPDSTSRRSASRLRRRIALAGLLALLLSPALSAQTVSFDLPDLDCLPLEENKVYEATVTGVEGGDSVRLYFRRLNRLGAFYYIEMAAKGADAYWSTFPQPEDREQAQLTDEWWKILETRDWMEGRDRDWLESFLEEQDQEASEFYVAVYGPTGEIKGRSETALTTVDNDDCFVPLDPKERGWADNLAIGETADVQGNKEVFHWLCQGIVTRINPEDVRRPDEYCRACVLGIVWVPPVAGSVIGVIGGGLVNERIITTTVPPEASPLQP